MDLPIHRQPRGESTVQAEFDRLRGTLSRDLEKWPDFIDQVSEAVRDVLPHADVEESDEAYVLDIELPGVRRDDVSVEVTQGRVVVTGERRERRRVGLLRHRTRTTGRFRFAASLPVELDPDGVTATLDDGLLTLTVPKAARARRRRISIGRTQG